jgi:hypothetical protein
MPARLIRQALTLAAAILAARCTPLPQATMTQPVQVMEQAWGPFARQCSTTRLAYYVPHRQLGPREVVLSHTTCIGFSATPRADGSVELTASMNADDPSADPIISRILRSPGGTSRTAESGDSGLLAYGSDAPDIAVVLARDIGVTARQMVSPNQELRLPIRLHMPFPVDGTMLCHPSGTVAADGRKVLVFACTLDQQADTSHLRARIVLSGEQRVDVETGVRLSGEMTGRLSGEIRVTDGSPWRPADDQVWYSKETEFE